jgi:hypothetical protein
VTATEPGEPSRGVVFAVCGSAIPRVGEEIELLNGRTAVVKTVLHSVDAVGKVGHPPEVFTATPNVFAEFVTTLTPPSDAESVGVSAAAPAN